MPGPPPKRADRRQHHGRHDARTAAGGPRLIALPQVDREVPEPITGWTVRTKREWATFWSSGLSDLVHPADVPTLERLFWLRDQAGRIQRAVQGSGMLAQGSQGQPVLSPLCRQLDALHREIRELEKEFGLTPMARLRLGATFADAGRSLEALSRAVDDTAEELSPVSDPRLRTVDEAPEPG